jgi:hypothetical protein
MMSPWGRLSVSREFILRQYIGAAMYVCMHVTYINTAIDSQMIAAGYKRYEYAELAYTL